MSLERRMLSVRWNRRMIPACGLELPTGTVTFLFTDVEGSTSLLNELGAEAYARRSPNIGR